MTALHSPFGAIKLTALGAEQVSVAAQNLKGRERQFLLLLQRNDSISQQICAAMLPKVDLQALLVHRLIWVEDESKLTALEPNKAQTDNTEPQADEGDESLDPLLQLAAGRV